MRPESLFIAGLGSCLPPTFSAADAVARGWYDAESLELDGWLGAAVAGDLSPPEMALQAARSAIDRSGLAVEEIGIVLHGCNLPQGPHLWPPQTYVERHAVGRGVPCMELRQGCTALFAALELLAGYLALPVGPQAALVTLADNWGFDPAFGADPKLRWRYAHNGQTSRGSILGDAGAAAVLSRCGGFARILSLVTRSLAEMEEVYRAGMPLFPPGSGTGQPLRLGERVRDHEQRHPGSVASLLRQLNHVRIEGAREALDDAGVVPAQIKRVVHIFSGTERYVRQFLQPLGIDPARGVVEFGRRLGHLAACDPVVGLEHLVDTRQVGEGDHVLLMGNSMAGAISCAVLSIVAAPRWVR